MSETPKLGRGRVFTHPGKKSRTRQAFADEGDINKVLGRWRTTGEITHVNLGRPVYGDFTRAVDFRAAQNQIKAAEALFESLPARVRDRVNNDPAQLIEFVADKANEDELRDLGLHNPIVDTQIAPVTPEPASASETPPKTEEPA